MGASYLDRSSISFKILWISSDTTLSKSAHFFCSSERLRTWTVLTSKHWKILAVFLGMPQQVCLIAQCLFAPHTIVMQTFQGWSHLRSVWNQNSQRLSQSFWCFHQCNCQQKWCPLKSRYPQDLLATFSSYELGESELLLCHHCFCVPEWWWQFNQFAQHSLLYWHIRSILRQEQPLDHILAFHQAPATVQWPWCQLWFVLSPSHIYVHFTFRQGISIGIKTPIWNCNNAIQFALCVTEKGQHIKTEVLITVSIVCEQKLNHLLTIGLYSV